MEGSWQRHARAIAGRYTIAFGSANHANDLNGNRQSEARRRELRTCANAGLVCSGQGGYPSFGDKPADLLFEVVNRRYERGALVLTTRRIFSEWNEVFPSTSCITAVVDGLAHHADVTALDGKSYRLRESEMEAAQQRRKK